MREGKPSKRFGHLGLHNVNPFNQPFRRKHRTEALRDAHVVTNTFAGGMLATCHPGAVQ